MLIFPSKDKILHFPFIPICEDNVSETFLQEEELLKVTDVRLEDQL